MTRDETKELLMTIRAVYPNFNVKPEEMTPTINAWTMMLEEFPYEAVKCALKIYIKTNNTGFAPSVSQLIGAMYKPIDNEQLSEGEAWNMVKRAIQDGNYHAEERFASLPPTVQQAIGSANMIQQWANTNSDEVNTVIMSNFQRSYRIICDRERFNEKVPEQIGNVIKGLVNKTSGERLLEG